MMIEKRGLPPRIKQPDLVLLPPMSQGRVEEARQLWADERWGELARRDTLNKEELRLIDLEDSPRGQQLRDIYKKAIERPHQGISSRTVESQDDALILFRIALEHAYSFSPPIDPADKVLAVKLIKVEVGTLPRLRIGSVLENFFPSHREALIAAYPSLDLQPFQFSSLPVDYWTDEENGKARAQQAIKWRLEVEMEGPKIEPLEYRDWLKKVKIEKQLSKYSIYNRVLRVYERVSDTLVDAYPELDLRPWEFRTYYQGIGGEDIVRRATRWLIEERLGLSPDSPNFATDIKAVRAKHFTQGGLSSYVSRAAGNILGSGSYIKLLMATYPEHGLTEESFSRFAPNTWQGEEGRQRAIYHIRRIVEAALGSDSVNPEFRAKLRLIRGSDFVNNNLEGMLRTVYKRNVSTALKDAYPELDLREWELPGVPKNFWQTDNHANVKKAIKLFFEEELGLNSSDEGFKDRVLSATRNQLLKSGVGSLFKATKLTLLQGLRIAYPELALTDEEFKAANSMREKRFQGTVEVRVTKEEANTGLDSLFE